MTQKQQKVYELLKEFLEICNKHNLDYCAVYGTALGAIRHKGFIPWDDDVDLLISDETYRFLKENYRELIVDWETTGSFLPFPKFSKDKDDLIDVTFLDLFVVVPTTKQKVKKLLSWKNQFRFLNNFTNRKFFKVQHWMKFLKVIFFWTRMFKKIYYEEMKEITFVPKGDQQIIFTWLDKRNTWNNVYEKIDFFDTIEVDFEDIKIRVPKDYETMFLKNYGTSWRIPKKTAVSEHLGMYDMWLSPKKEENKNN